jgi:hypothetical protein
MKATTLIGMCALLACTSPTTTGTTETESTPLLRGGWTYTATQSDPQLRMSGTLTITQQDDNQIYGSIDYMEYDRAGVGRHRVELFSGRIRGNGTVTIDAAALDGPRRHTGVLLNDSIGGDFERPGNGNGRLYGSFGARRR